MNLLVVYDINTGDEAGGHRLHQVAKVCEGFGVRVQHSVFELDLSDGDFLRFVAAVSEVIDPELDSVLVYGRSPEPMRCLGRARTADTVRGPVHW